MAFGNLNRMGSNPEDGAPPPPADLEAVDAPAAAAPAAAANAFVKGSFTRLGSSTAEPAGVPVPDDVDDGPSPDAPETGRDAFDEIGDMIKAQPAPSVSDKVASPSTAPAAEAASAGSGASPSAKDEPKDEDDLEEQARRLAQASGVSFEEAMQAIKAERVAQAAKESGVNPADAQRAFAQQDPRARRAAEEEMARRAAASGGGGGGGGIGGAVGALVGGVKSGFMGAAGMTRNAYDGLVAERIFRRRYEAFQDGVDGMSRAGDELRSGMEEFNAAFLGSNAASRLREMAKQEGVGFDEYMQKLNSGSIDSPEAVAAAKEAMSEPAVAQAWQKVDDAASRLETSAGEAHRNLGRLGRSYSDRVDLNAEAEKLSKAGDEATAVVDPAVANEDTKKLMKRLEEMAEGIRKAVEKLVERIAGLFRR